MQTYTICTRLVPALVLVAALGIDTPSWAIFLPPDIVDVPTARLIENLDKTLASAQGEDRIDVLLQLARVHSVAYASKAQGTAVANPVKWSSAPAVIDGPHEDRDVRGALGYVYGRGSNLIGMLKLPKDFDARYGCLADNLKSLIELDGEITYRFVLPKGAPGSQVKPAKLEVARESVGNEMVVRCLSARLSEAALFAAKETASKVELTFRFETMGKGFKPYFGRGPFTVPGHVAEATSDEQLAQAKAHLAKARARYQEVVRARPESPSARLGLAWVLEQEGKLEEAKKAYRETFELAWKTERNLTRLGLTARPIAAEVATYLVPLLDERRDAEEIAELRAAAMKLRALPRPVTPIVVPLTSAASSLSELIDEGSEVRFDLDGSGDDKRWGWVRPEAALLVWDPAQRGDIHSGLQLFGSVSFWVFWRDGYQALAALDDDGDGELSGDELTGLALWRDLDGDGVSDPDEVAPVADHGIRAIATRAVVGLDGVLGATRGVAFDDGTVRPTWDWVPVR